MSNGICWDSDDELEAFFERIAPQRTRRESLLEFVRCKGSREQCAEYIRAWHDKGCDGLVFFFSDIASVGDGTSQAEVFRRDVFPQV